MNYIQIKHFHTNKSISTNNSETKKGEEKILHPFLIIGFATFCFSDHCYLLQCSHAWKYQPEYSETYNNP